MVGSDDIIKKTKPHDVIKVKRSIETIKMIGPDDVIKMQKPNDGIGISASCDVSMKKTPGDVIKNAAPGDVTREILSRGRRAAVSAQEQATILELHNKLRAQEGASNMEIMVRNY